MPNTLLQGAPYPAGTTSPNVPADIQALGQFVEKKVVQVYASSAARAAAFTAASLSPSEGMLCWLQDTDVHEKYTGAAWVRLDWYTAWGVVGGQNYPGSGNLAAGVSSEVYLNVSSGNVTLIGGRRYRVDWSMRLTMSTLGIYPIAILRDGITTASTPVGNAITFPVPDTNPYLMQGGAEFDIGSTTTKTLGVTGRASSGLMNISRDAQTLVTVKDIGPAGLVTAV